MSVGAVRFIHASDFRLDRPLGGIADVAGQLREPFIEAPYRAARRVFDAAIQEEVDFVVLAGDLLDTSVAGPRGVLFLQEQFQRLAQHGIHVYWGGGLVDGPDDWPQVLELPENVHHFPTGEIGEFSHERAGQVIARLIGQSRGRRKQILARDYCDADASPLTIAVTRGVVEAEDEPLLGAPDYWALGGQHQSRTFELAGKVAHYPGSPQGRCPSEPGPHCCTLVRVAADGTRQSRPIITDVLRWLTMRLRLDERASQESFEQLLRDASKALLGKEAGADLLVTWSIEGGGALWETLHRGPLATQWLNLLRGEFGFTSPSLWSVAISAVPPALESYDPMEDGSLLGDYLRTLREGELASDEIDLRPYLTEWSLHALPDQLAHIAPADRDGVLRQAALMGRDLLRGEVQPS